MAVRGPLTPPCGHSSGGKQDIMFNGCLTHV